MDRASVIEILNLLIEEYGDRRWQPRHEPISVLVRTILSQNTSDRNSNHAYDSLLASFNTWDDMADSDIDRIAYSIKSGGLGGVKAQYIKQVLQEIRQRQNGFELDFLKRLPLNEARDWLRELPGVGMKTASCVLLFSLGMPALPVDTHVFRVAQRLGLAYEKTPEKLEQSLLKAIPSQWHKHASFWLIYHGRFVCKAINPMCSNCPFQKICPFYKKNNKF